MQLLTTPPFRANLPIMLGILATTAGLGFAGSTSAAENPVGLDGYCPVCIVDGGKWMPGNPEHVAVYDGRTYQFPEAAVRDKFVASPEKYVPALNGDCIVCYAKGGKRAAGSVDFAAAYKGRVYLFPSAGIKQEFLSSPAKYAAADLAAEGNCIVCKVKAGKDMPGKAEFTAIHNGLRYQFRSDNERNVFVANPAEFVRTSVSTLKAPSTGMKTVSVEGRSGCAACEFRVHPIGNPEELGLAVRTDDGSVYVVEGAHQNYSKIYDDRFDQIRLSVTGVPLKTQGNVTWLKPQSVARVN